MSQAPDFGDLRSLLNTPPTPQSWEQLCIWLEEWESEEHTQRIHAYITAYLNRWPDQARRVPKRWLQKLTKEKIALPWLSICRTLNLRGFRAREMRQYNKTLSDIWLDVLTRPHLEDISILDLGSNGLTCKDLERFLQTSTLEHLKTLELQRNPLTNELSELLMTPHRFESTIETLGLRQTSLEDDALRLIPLERWTALRTLDVYGNDLLAHTLGHLQECPQLESLNVGKNARLSWSSMLRLPALRHLYVERTPLKNAAFSSILEHHDLTTLHAWGCELENPRGALAHGPRTLASCQTLNLGMNTVGSALINELCELPMPALNTLNLHGASLTDQDASTLLSASWSGQLKELYMGANPLSSTTRRALKAHASQHHVTLHV